VRRAGILVRTTGKGTRYVARWYDAYGKRCAETFGTEAAARAALRQRQVEADKVRAGLARPRSDKRLAEVAPEWLKTRPAKRREDDASRLEHHILPFLGEHRLAEINPTVLQRFVRHLEQKVTARVGQKTPTTLKPMTIKNVLVVLCKMLGDLGFPTRVKYKVPTSGYAWIQRPEDVGRFLDACKPEWFRVAAALALYAGLRKGEVAGLRRDAIDFDRGLLRVDRSYDGPVKSKHVRWAPMPPALAAILRQWMLAHPGELLVTAEGARLAEDTALHGYARRSCKRAGIASVNFHQLRHTAASHLAQRVPLPLVGAVLGHADPKTTARYAHLDTESVARDPRLYLTFEAPAGIVIPLEGMGSPRDHEVDTAVVVVEK
jgi:integrase